jgi:hypothetical protein
MPMEWMNEWMPVTLCNLILMPKQHPVLANVLNFFTFTSIFIVTRQPGCLYSTSSLPSANFLQHLELSTLDRTYPPCVSHNKMKVLVAVFFNFITNLMFIHCLIFLVSMISIGK